MEENNKQLKSIWGKWWESIRKWFYPAWLLYETSVRFYDYAQSTHHYFIEKQSSIASHIGDIGAQALSLFCSITSFSICFIFLTVPTCFILYKFFEIENLTATNFERRIKPFF